MRKRIYILFVIITISFNLLAEVSFKAISPGKVLKGDKFQITFSLQNGEASNFSGPQIEGCKLLSDRGVSSFSSYRNINGKTTASKRIDYTCLYRAEKVGKVTVPSVMVLVDGKQYKSEPITFVIEENTGKPNQRMQSSIFEEEYTSQPPTPISGDELFVRIILSKEQAYEQEPIECTIKLYTQYNISSFLPTTQPSFDGFIIEDFTKTQALNQVETYNGKDYYTAILKQCMIFPQKSGKLKINSGKYEIVAEKYEKVTFGGGYAYSRIPVREKLSISSNSASVNVIPLPSPCPDNFSGAVGDFEITTKLSSQTFRTNEASNYIYEISGSGNIKYIKEPIIDLPIEFEQYTPKSKFDTKISNGEMIGTATFEYTFVPKSIGKFNISEHDFVYFSPKKKEYITLKSQRYTIDVVKGVSNGNEQHDVITKNVDIRYISLGEKNIGQNSLIVFSIWYWMLLIIIILCFIFLIWYKNRKTKLSSDIIGLKLEKANKVAQKRLKLANRYMNDSKNKEFYEEINNALCGYLSDKLSIPTSQLSKDNIIVQLEQHGLNENICNHIIDILDICEMALYTPQSDETKISEIYASTINAINEIETIKIRRK